MVKNLPVPFFADMTKDPYGFALTQLLLTIPVMFIGKRFFTTGIPLLFRGNPNMDSLVAIGAGASFIYSVVMTYAIPYYHHAVHNLYYESVAVVITLVSLGKQLELRSQKKTESAIKKLMELSPDTAVVLRDGKELTVPTGEVAVGETIIVKPGAKVPLDGVVTDGISSVNEAMLTGESIPVEKSTGSRVIGGSINISGVIYVKVTNIGEDTALAKIIKFVEDAQNKKAPISKTADKVAGVFVPAVIIIAVLAAAAWLIAGKEISFVLKVFTGVLVIACPCALGLATPTAIMAAIGQATKHGVIIKSGEALEKMGKVDAIAFDKTGTLTYGRLAVSDIVSFSPTLSEADLLSLLSSAEALSEHPLAKAITAYAKSAGTDILPADNFQMEAGRGIQACVAGHELICGSEAFLRSRDITLDDGAASRLGRLHEQGKATVLAAEKDRCLGVIALSDTVRPEAKAAVSQLSSLGAETLLLTGDNRKAAEFLARQVGSMSVRAELLPDQKVDDIRALQKTGRIVCMIGDGVNDAPALKTADVGVAMGSMGSNIAVEAADIALMSDDISRLPYLKRLSNAAVHTIRLSISLSLCINFVAIALSLMGLLTPTSGALVHNAGSVFVVLIAALLYDRKFE